MDGPETHFFFPRPTAAVPDFPVVERRRRGVPRVLHAPNRALIGVIGTGNNIVVREVVLTEGEGRYEDGPRHERHCGGKKVDGEKFRSPEPPIQPRKPEEALPAS
jgi:hypothetical protein